MRPEPGRGRIFKIEAGRGRPVKSRTYLAETEVNNYLKMELKSKVLDKDLIRFWKKHSDIFPRLSKIAFKMFSIPATNLSSERNFNYCTMTLTDKRSGLYSEKVNKMLFIRSNIDLM